tara:strand:- start:1315 stop:1803 length:489 start_codon:yes stop_codon:yes gene_type:complete
MAEYTIQGIQDRRKEVERIQNMLARVPMNPRLGQFFTPSLLAEVTQDLNQYTAGYNAQVKAEEDRIRAEQEAERKRIEEEQKRIQEQIEAEQEQVQADEREEEFGVRDPADVPGVIENRRRQAAVDKASSMAVRLTSRGTRGRRGTSTSARRGRGFFDRYFA